MLKMVRNRNKLINLFVGNIANVVVHRILEKAIDNSEIAGRYRKELINSLQIAKEYRKKINPPNKLLEKDVFYIKDKVFRRVKAELFARIKKGYQRINLDSINKEIEIVLKDIEIL